MPFYAPEARCFGQCRGRQSPGMIGFAFNNRLLLGGFAGEPDSARGVLNPFGDPAQENLTLLLLDAHRMLTAESAELRLARNDPNFHDEGRKEITFRAEDAFKFRVVTLRQLRDARTFFHNGSFTRVRDVVAYFNAGVPQDPAAGGSPTLAERFTHPRGPGSPRGLGLSEDQVDALADFLENGLYDPAFVSFDPSSTTKTFQPNAQDLTYSVFRPDLAALGAVDGFVI